MRHHRGMGVTARVDGIFDDNWNSKTGLRACKGAEDEDSHIAKVGQRSACRVFLHAHMV